MTGATKTVKKGRPVLTLFLLLVLLGSGAIVLLRFVPPPVTFLMASRAMEGEGFDYRWRSLDRISPRLVQAVIASEDSTFCAHYGFDMKAIETALKANERGGRVRGGSTITQQTAKNVFLWPGRDWIRKGLEAGYAVAIETVWGKRRIMEVYLNVAEWAPGVYGAEAAAQHWFDKPAEDLSAREAARLAAILPSPRTRDAANPDRRVRRRTSTIQAAMGTVRNDGLAACVTG